MMSGRVGAWPELLDQDDPIEDRIVGQNRRGVPALEDLAEERLAPAAAMQLVAQLVTIDLEPALVDGGLLEDFDVVAREFGGCGHGFRTPDMKSAASPSMKEAISSAALGSR